jgi:hypothetical protein
MNRRPLGALAIVIILLMVIVATAGLDNLPRNLRNSVAAASIALNADRAQLSQNRDFVTNALSREPVLFRTRDASFRQRLDKDNSCLASAGTELAVLEKFAKDNKRTDAPKVESELARFDSLRKGCAQDAAGVRAETERWLNYKRDLPQRLASMKASYETLHAFDVDAAVAPAKKAETDWPAKRDDLEARVKQLESLKAQGEQVWDSSAKLRADAEAGRVEDLDYATLFQSADRLDDDAKQLKQGSDSLNQLAAQLYTSWDKLLVDVDTDHGVREKVRLVKTQYQDATLAQGTATSAEQWEDAASAKPHDLEKRVGMVIARKAAGHYDSEAQNVVEPPAIAYVAPPGQSNAYGSWQNGVWTWLPQYLILRQLLNASRGPIVYGDYYGWQDARRHGDIYYGRSGSRWWRGSRTPTAGGGIGGAIGRAARDWASRSSGSGSGGGFYTERPKSYGERGGFSGSRYQSRGSFSGSRYQSRGGFGSFGSRSRGFGGAMRSMGRGGRR